MNESVIIQKLIQVGQMLERGELEYSSAEADIKYYLEQYAALRQPLVSISAWEHKLIGKNKHSVFTWCKDCHSEGVNIPFNDECGNCGSKNNVRYYDKETIDLLF